MWNLLIGPIAETVNTVLKRVLPAEKMSEAERATIEKEVTLALATQDFQQVMGQVQINLEQAKKESLFIAGARPFIMWTVGTAFAYHLVLQPLTLFTLSLLKWGGWVDVAGFPELPDFDIDNAMAIMGGLLGISLSGMRSWEKSKRVNKNR